MVLGGFNRLIRLSEESLNSYIRKVIHKLLFFGSYCPAARLKLVHLSHKHICWLETSCRRKSLIYLQRCHRKYVHPRRVRNDSCYYIQLSRDGSCHLRMWLYIRCRNRLTLVRLQNDRRSRNIRLRRAKRFATQSAWQMLNCISIEESKNSNLSRISSPGISTSIISGSDFN